MAAKPKLQEVANFFHIGELISAPQRITGGDLNINWKIETSEGVFAVKEINPTVSKKDGICEQYQLTEEIAAYFKKQGIPAIASLSCNGSRVFKNGGVYLVYPFVEGAPLDTIDKDATQEIARVFYDLHHPIGNIREFSSLPDPDFQFPSVEKWKELIAKSDLSSLATLLPIVEKFEEPIFRAIPTLKLEQVVSHRDLHPWNVLWNHGRPQIVDWECAGMVNPIQETVGYFLEWANIMSSNFAEEQYMEMMKTYFSRPLKFQTSLIEGFYGWLAFSPLLWTFFNIERSLDVSTTPEERQRGKDLISKQLVDAVQFIASLEPRIIANLQETESWRRKLQAPTTFTLQRLISLYSKFNERGCKVWIDGGWGIDILLGRQNREHSDVDIVVEKHFEIQIKELLKLEGFKDIDTDDRRPWNYVMEDTDGMRVDFHIIDLSSDGRGIYGPVENNQYYPAQALTGNGVIAGIDFHCISPEYQLESHTGYKITEKDRRDVSLICERFKLDIPPGY